MRARIGFLVLLLTSAGPFLVGCSGQRPTAVSTPVEATAAASIEPTPAPTPARLLAIDLPTNVSALMAKLGKPRRVDLPSQADLDATPVGQWFRWAQAGTGYTVSALGDEYSRKANYRAPVRYVELAVGSSKARATTLYGFELNSTTRGDVVKRLGTLVRADGNLKSWGHDALTYVDGDMYVYFFFGRDGRLIGVASSTFDIDHAG
jgi:hypothetical protein